MKILPVYSSNVNRNVQFTCAYKKLPVIKKQQQAELSVFMHHIYEFKKGLRSLILTTEKNSNKEYIENRLKKEKIAYIIEPVSEKSSNINVFFGNEDCINVIKTFNQPLSKLSDEQDFMLGIMLGYDKILQCQRYMKRLNSKINIIA